MENLLEKYKKEYPQKFASEEEIFSHIRAGDKIFIGTGCGEPLYLVQSLIQYVESHPKAFSDAEILNVWTLGVAPYVERKFQKYFRHNSFFISNNTRAAINNGLADYTPVFLSSVPDLFRHKIVPVDVALIQVSVPDEHGFVSLGISVDIVKAAAESADIVIAQVNSHMPRVYGDSFIHLQDLDFILHRDEALLEFEMDASGEVTQQIGKYISEIVHDEDTIQVGYGSITNAALKYLQGKKNLGVHTELLSDGIVELIKSGTIDNSRKSINRGKTVATFCMGKKETYEFLHNNPAIEFRPIDYTNNPLIIAQNKKMTAINSALEVDLTGQATAESIGAYFYSGTGGQADFMRGAIWSKGGKSILALRSTTADGKKSRIVPFLQEGAGVTLNRGDLHYVVTEFGIAYLYGKNIREKAMSLISIAHPNFRSRLIEEAKKHFLIYRDQKFIPGKRGEYPEDLEMNRTTKSGLKVYIRPVKISDEPLLKKFIYSLSDASMYKRFLTKRVDMPHEMLQDFFVVIDYTREMVLLALKKVDGKEEIIGIGQYSSNEGTQTAEVALVVRDDFQHKGLGTELFLYLMNIAKKQGLQGFTGEVLVENKIMIKFMEKMGLDIKKDRKADIYHMKMPFR